jgi:tRNA modification GTPase
VQLDDTIVAISTPPGRGGLGVVRLAGPEARAIAAPMLRLKRHQSLEPGGAVFGELVDAASGERIDEVVVTYFAKPHSYTTDDMVEISAHGSPVVLCHVVEAAISKGARLAEPGEFTMRAFLNGRIDLTQAEAVRDLIESQTLFQAKAAAQQLDGSLSKRLKPIKEKLVELIATLEAGVDFAEDDVAVLPSAQILERIGEIRGPLQRLEESFAYGKVVHEGLTLAIVGAPNVGKSSIFNRLVERERAIVTAAPGTTRDLVTEIVSLGGFPLKLVDTAGIRIAKDEAEGIGIRKSYEALAEADLVLVVTEASEAVRNRDESTAELEKALGQRKSISVVNKVDLYGQDGRKMLTSNGRPRVYTSAVTGEGIEELRAKILAEAVGDGGGTEYEAGFLSNARQHGLVRDSLVALARSAAAVDEKVPHEMLLLDLYSSLRPLDGITGATTADDLLNRIFSSFCIGK